VEHNYVDVNSLVVKVVLYLTHSYNDN